MQDKQQGTRKKGMQKSSKEQVNKVRWKSSKKQGRFKVCKKCRKELDK